MVKFLKTAGMLMLGLDPSRTAAAARAFTIKAMGSDPSMRVSWTTGPITPIRWMNGDALGLDCWRVPAGALSCHDGYVSPSPSQARPLGWTMNAIEILRR